MGNIDENEEKWTTPDAKFGVEALEALLNLTIDLVKRDKKNLATSHLQNTVIEPLRKEGRMSDMKEIVYTPTKPTEEEPNWKEIAKKQPPKDDKQNIAWRGAWLEGEMVGYARCMVDKVLSKPTEEATETQEELWRVFCDNYLRYYDGAYSPTVTDEGKEQFTIQRKTK